MSDNAFEKILQEKLSKLVRESEPERDLWPAIERALIDPQRSNKRRFTAIAATVVVLSCSLFFWQANKSKQPTALFSQLQTNHEQQMKLLYTNYEDQQALTDNWQQQLLQLDVAAQEILNALEKDPDNMDLLKMLKNVYQQQLNLVERVHKPKWQYIYDANREVAL